jgi:hypothetical protein
MFDLFDFDLPGAVTEQLEKKLRTMPSSQLTARALQQLAAFQEKHAIQQGVYQLLLKDKVVYVGKATDVKERLQQHYEKLRGRRKLKMSDIRFRCLLLHPNWSTSANEDLLIAHYKDKGQCQWNSSGFGAKDVGRERDGTEPNWFDTHYPINDEYPCDGIKDRETVGDLLQKLKQQLPYTFRFEIRAAEANSALNLEAVPRTARSLITCVVKSLGPRWQATVFRSHIVFYKETRAYKHGERL